MPSRLFREPPQVARKAQLRRVLKQPVRLKVVAVAVHLVVDLRPKDLLPASSNR